MEYDNKTGYYYYFNHRTGESRWAEEDDLEDYDGGTQEQKRSRNNSSSRGDKSQHYSHNNKNSGKGVGMRMGPTGAGGLDEEVVVLEQGVMGEDSTDESAHGGEGVVMLESSRKAQAVHEKTQAIVTAFSGE